MNHIISGHNFHGRYRVVLRGAKDGFALTNQQFSRLSKALCGIKDCTCGGGYGDGADPGTARVIYGSLVSAEDYNSPDFQFPQ